MFLRLSRQKLISLDNGGLQDSTRHSKESTDRFHYTKQIWKKICSNVLEFWVECNEYLIFQGCSTQNLEFGNFVGHTVCIIYFLVRFTQDNVLKPNKDKIKNLKDYFDLSSSSTLQKYDFYQEFASFSGTQKTLSVSNWYDAYLKDINFLVQVLAVFLVALNALITMFFLVWSYKDYSLFHIKTVPKSNNIQTRSLTELYGGDVHKQTFLQKLKSTYHFLTQTRVEKCTKDTDVFYQFSRWAPSPFSTALFTSFNPVAVIFLYFNDTKPQSLISLFLLQYVMKYLIIDNFERARKDEQIFVQALVEESTSKLLAGYTGINQNATPLSNRKIFITHSLSGEIVKEAYNYKKQEFEII